MKTCVRLSGSMEEMLSQARLAKDSGANLAAVELDSAENVELLGMFPVPVLLSVKHANGNKRTLRLMDAMKFRSEFVELDMSCPAAEQKKIIDMARMNGIKVMMSYTDDKKTPPLEKLKAVLDEAAKSSSYLKVRTIANSRDDVETLKRLFKTAREKNVRLTAFAAGRHGATTMTNPDNFLIYCRIGSEMDGTATPTLKQARYLIDRRIEKRIRDRISGKRKQDS